ncbi:ABC transporter permease [Streptomyces sp. NBC_00178]|uniref:hypothetical protein n=1 Tax=Streptomyces sp. NBC_00178 TaxID=2975672 RepID=UPI002E2C247F|nr:hypothetical protein [Streptomyces sp. NBC_00178]
MSTTLTRPRPSLRGPVRVVVRQHRTTLWIGGGLALAVLLALIAVTLRSSHVTQVFLTSGCPIDGGAGRHCNQTARNYAVSMFRYDNTFNLIATVLMAMPALLSGFVAGPMIGRELESGTFKLSWTQSMSPARWLAAKLAVPAVLLVTVTAVLSAVLHWVRSRLTVSYTSEWSTPYVFATTGTVPIAHVLLGLCAGALVGLLVRRTVPALALSALVTVAAVIALTALRPLLWPPRTLVSATDETGSLPRGSWITDTGRITDDGVRHSVEDCWEQVADRPACLAGRAVTGEYADYHPASHFWPLQLVETGIALALAALALALAFRVLRRRSG